MEQFLFKKVEIWIVLLLAIFGITGTVFFGAAVRSFYLSGRHDQLASLANEIATIPANTKKIFKGQFGKTEVSILDQRFNGESGFMFNYHPGERFDLGYLLLNRYDADLEMSVSELVA